MILPTLGSASTFLEATSAVVRLKLATRLVMDRVPKRSHAFTRTSTNAPARTWADTAVEVQLAPTPRALTPAAARREQASQCLALELSEAHACTEEHEIEVYESTCFIKLCQFLVIDHSRSAWPTVTPLVLDNKCRIRVGLVCHLFLLLLNILSILDLEARRELARKMFY